jgi:hypothetical protein
MVARVLLLPVLAWVIGCGDDVTGSAGTSGSTTQTLSRADVADMPPGSARGTLYSGTYLVEGSSIDACVCRAGTCDPFSALTGATATVSALDGVLTSVGDGTCTGGVDTDGRFWCGEAEESATGAVYGRQQGTFLLADGQPTSKEFTVDTTVVMTIRGQAYDCDLHASGRARYVSAGP